MVRLISTSMFRRLPAVGFLFDAGEELAADGWPSPSKDPHEFVPPPTPEPRCEYVEPLTGGVLLEEGDYQW